MARPRAVGAYIFAGGFTLGVATRFDVLCHLEDGPFGVATARRNFDFPVHEDPVTWPVRRLRREGVDLVYCNPPCSPWSNAGTNKGPDAWRSDPLASCVGRCFDLLRTVRPAIWTFESVRGVWAKGRDMLDDMAATAASLGYATTHLLVAGENHGVPQPRKRYLMVCHRVEIPWTPPRGERVTAGAALRVVRDPRGDGGGKPIPPHVDVLYDDTPRGKRFRRTFDRLHDESQMPRDAAGKVTGRPGFLYFKLDRDALAPTLTGSATVAHDVERRYLTVNEYKALCGYPQDFKFEGSDSSKYAQLCKAVMPPVAEYLARQFSRGLRRGRAIQSPSTRLVEVGAGSVSEDDL